MGKLKELNEEKEQLEIQYDLDITRWSELEEIKNNNKGSIYDATNIIALLWV